MTATVIQLPIINRADFYVINPDGSIYHQRKELAFDVIDFRASLAGWNCPAEYDAATDTIRHGGALEWETHLRTGDDCVTVRCVACPHGLRITE